MIELARFDDPRPARQLALFLEGQGIEVSIEQQDGLIRLYLRDEIRLEQAREWRDAFIDNPFDPRFRPSSPWQKSEPAPADQALSMPPLFTGQWLRSMGPVTRSLFVASVAIYLVHFFVVEIYQWLMFPRSLTDLASQPWRLFTPMLIHLNLLHIIFNMLWWTELGRIIERYQSSWQLLWITLITGALSALAQFLSTGPLFGGMSGVVYGLLGYLWLYGQVNPAAGYRLRKEIVYLMLGWLVFCYIGLADIVANEAHLAGLISGCLLGVAVGYWRRRYY